MQNEIWERVIDFLNSLRCENISRDTSIKIPRYEDIQRELEMLRKKCEIIVQQFSKEGRQALFEWMEKAEEMLSLEGQKAYCQGYLDCILLLNGFGLFRQDISSKELIEKLK